MRQTTPAIPCVLVILDITKKIYFFIRKPNLKGKETHLILCEFQVNNRVRPALSGSNRIVDLGCI